ncbi:putative ABC transporter ATP-binding protein [Streptomyces hygroscopicus subsp. jinggangensis 5008]|nr:putative ABC transporter ATP-binding protein [Streptomyces hygroscopicus subsp. jinggangensis 5008]AGF60113.1 putative ABC transporter ATP-binding protein [Streptomyces hygroscopicus subsp. jinggangensis TL01]
MDSQFAIRARGITKCFGDVVALDGVDLEVAQGRIHGLVGPNGAGKTTLLGLLLGLAVADSGSLEILGTPVGRAFEAPGGVSGFVDGPGLYPSLTARQNLAALAALRGDDTRAAGIDDVLDQVGLTDVADERTRGFSLGMRQRLGLAAALLTRPRLLILDEPSNGLDPAGKKHVHGVLTRLAREGTSVVLSSHRMDDLEALCSEVTILATGRIVFSGPLGELAAEHRELDYRLVTSDPERARRLAADAPGIRLADDTAGRQGGEALVLRALVPDLDDLVVRLVHEGIALRELAPVVSPLEAAFLALTEQRKPDAPQQDDADAPLMSDAPRQDDADARQKSDAQQQDDADAPQKSDTPRQNDAGTPRQDDADAPPMSDAQQQETGR